MYKQYGKPEMEDEFVDYADEYDDEEYGSQNYDYYNAAANAGMIEGSGGSYDEEDVSDESGMVRQQLLQQQLAAAQAAAQAKKMGGAPGFLGGAAGKAGGAGLYQGAGSKPAGAGGFTYGAASAGGSLFGAASAAGGSSFASGLGGTQFGAPPKATGLGGTQFGAPAKSTSGGFAFGQASQFGGIGGGGMGGMGGGMGGGTFFGAASGAGGLGLGQAPAGAMDDPYNIPVDLTKIKRTEKPLKTFEEKTSEEKLQTMKQMGLENSATGAKSIIKKPGQAKNKKGISFGQCQIYQYDKDPNDNTIAKKIDSKDISDMRDEKTKLRDQLQAKENEQLAQIKKTLDLLKDNSATEDKFKSSAAPASKIEDSIGESGSLSHSKGKQITESYDTDTFEDHSQSVSHSQSKDGSASKKGINYWPGKDAMEGSYSVSQSKEASEQMGTANAMEEYLKKQEQMKKAGGVKSAPAKPVAASKEFSESSDKYTDEEFDSMSKSQNAFLGLPKVQGGQKIPSTFNKYIKKENKFVQTDMGKYSFMNKDDINKDWTMKRNLEDANNELDEHRNISADHKDEIYHLKEKNKQMEMDLRAAKREAANMHETNNRMKEQLKDTMHKMNLYKIETENLIRQIDLADAKTREKEDDLRLMEAEYDRKLKLQEDRMLMRKSKNEEREQREMERKHYLEIEELKIKMDERMEEIDYFKSKTEKLEVENNSLRIGKGDNKKMREMENELQLLKVQLEDAKSSGGQTSSVQAAGNMDLRVKKNLTQDEQVQLQRELQQLDLIVKGYMDENQKSMRKQKTLEEQLKQLTEKHNSQEKLLKEFQLKALKERKGIFVDEAEDVNMQASNVMGSQSISQKQLQELYAKVQELQSENDNAKRSLSLQAGQLQAQTAKVRDEKQLIEKQLFEAEFVIAEKEKEIEKVTRESNALNNNNEVLIAELQDKVQFFRENQQLLTDNEVGQKTTNKELNDLKLQVQKGKEDRKRIVELEKKCKLLEDTAKSKNPNSIGMLIQAAKTDVVRDGDSESKRQLEMKISQLNYELETQDKEFETKLRAMRQEQERIKANYEARQGNSADAKLVKQLEDELQKTKNYYNKRIREIEDKYKYGNVGAKASGRRPSTSGPSGGDSKDLTALKEQNDRLLKERNLLAQKVVDLEQSNQVQRRQSMSAIQASPRQEESINQDLKGIFYPGAQQEEKVSPKKPPRGVQQQSPKGSFISNLNPFSMEKPAAQEKSVPELLEIFSKIDINKTFGQKEIKINQLYNVLASQMGVNITPQDLKNLNKFLIQRQDDNDVEFLGRDESILDLAHLQQFLPQSSQVAQLKDEIRRLRNKDQDFEFTMGQSQKLQRQLSHIENEKLDLQQKVHKLESQKSRLETVFKQTMKSGSMDLIDEVQLLVRRIEFLEEQSETRQKTTYLETQEPYLREIEMLKSKLNQERELRDQIIQKKNAEVSYFKAELDALLSEMQNQYKKKQASRVK